MAAVHGDDFSASDHPPVRENFQRFVGVAVELHDGSGCDAQRVVEIHARRSQANAQRNLDIQDWTKNSGVGRWRVLRRSLARRGKRRLPATLARWRAARALRHGRFSSAAAPSWRFETT